MRLGVWNVRHFWHSVHYQWDMGNIQREIIVIDLSAHCHWDKLLSEYCYHWQCDYNGYCLDANHISNIWLKRSHGKLLDPELKKRVDEKYKLQDDYKRGGVSYFKIAVMRSSDESLHDDEQKSCSCCLPIAK